jgi:hypothetical protein
MDDFWISAIIVAALIVKLLGARNKKIAKQLEEYEDDAEVDGFPPIPDGKVVYEEVSVPTNSKTKKRKSKPVVVHLDNDGQASEKVERQTKRSNTVTESAETEHKADEAAFTTNIEDVRRGIIWSEILNRKY